MEVKKMVNSKFKYVLGIDIGMASVGWCLLGEGFILDLGVRAFNKAENPDGGSLNADRREKRSTRRRLRRRAARLNKAKYLFVKYGLVPTNKPEELHNDNSEKVTPWELRVYGLDQKLNGKQFAQALHHIIKYRGFRSMRKSEAAESKEAGKLLSGVQGNHELLQKDMYRTPAEIALRHPDYEQHKRNKQGAYTHTFLRKDLYDEVQQLFNAQRRYDSKFATLDFEEQFLELLWEQKPALSGNAVLELIGQCTFEKNEKRTPKACYSFERFMWLQKLNNIRLYEPGAKRRELTVEEKNCIRDIPYKKGGNKFTYKQLRTLLESNFGLSPDTRFVGVTYGQKDPDEIEKKTTIIELKAFQEIRKAYEKNGLKTEWQSLASKPNKLDDIGYILTIYKTDDDIKNAFEEKGFSDQEINALLNLSFQKVGHLSLKAIKKILPHLETGMRYDQAASIEYDDFRTMLNAKKSYLLPPIDKEEIRNPIVFRALNQARKVINAIIKKHGSPMAVHIELARELSQPFDERKKIERAQKLFKEEKEAAIKLCQDDLGLIQPPKGLDLLKFRLYLEQDGKCAYSIKPLELNRLLEPGYVEVDHALPYSRSYDDSMLNKVLVLTEENRNKGNKIPYEYLQGAEHSQQWRNYEAYVLGNAKYRQAKRNRLLRKVLSKDDAQEFKERNLNDTRYIGRYLKNQIESYLDLHPESEAKRCVVVQGRMTSFLRTRWGILKVRQESDLHHAVDAAVVAACSHSMVKRISDFSRLKELETANNGYIDPETGEIVDIEKLRGLEKHFPEPWSGFRNELKARLSANPKEQFKFLTHYPEALYDNLKPVLVSRAPQRRNTGAAHQETVRSKKLMEKDGVSSVRTSLTKLTLTNLENMIGKDDPRNMPLYNLLKQRLEAFKGKGEKAFDPKQPPVYRPRQDGTLSSNIVKSIKLLSTQKTGVSVRHGIADNDSMIRADVFFKKGKYYLVPIYVADIAKKELPNKAIAAYKPEDKWTIMDPSFAFQFTLYPNDFIKLQIKENYFEGYYAGVDRATGALNLWAHDRSKSVGKNGLIRGIGVKSANTFEKYHVDALGEKFKVQGEERSDLAKYRNQQKHSS